jgi:hypothetical protein
MSALSLGLISRACQGRARSLLKFQKMAQKVHGVVPDPDLEGNNKVYPFELPE